jgi:hypothetical protein
MTYVQNISNQHYAYAIFMIMQSIAGREHIRSTIKAKSDELIQNIDGFIAKLEKKGYFAKLGLESAKDAQTKTKTTTFETLEIKSKAELMNKIEILKEKLSNIPDKDIDTIFNTIRTKYMIGEYLLVEGIILAFYEQLRLYMNYYYQLVDLQNRFDTRINIEDKLFKYIPQQALMDPALLKQYFPQAPKLQTLPEGEEKNDVLKNQILINNIGIVRPLVNYEEEAIILNYNPENPASEKIHSKFLKDIKDYEKLRDQEIKIRFEEIDQIVLMIVTDIIFDILDMHKQIFDKELKKAIKTRLVL